MTADKATAIIGLFGALLNTLATLKTDTSTVSGMPAEGDDGCQQPQRLDLVVDDGPWSPWLTR